MTDLTASHFFYPGIFVEQEIIWVPILSGFLSHDFAKFTLNDVTIYNKFYYILY